MASRSNRSPSSSSHNEGSSTRRRIHRVPNRRLNPNEPVVCDCGFRAVLKMSHTTSNPERPFYGCPNYTAAVTHNVPGLTHCDFFCWADLEVGNDGGEATEKDRNWKVNMALKIAKLEAEHRIMKCSVFLLYCAFLVIMLMWVIYVGK